MVSPTWTAARFAQVDPRLAPAGMLYAKITNKLAPAVQQKLFLAGQQLSREERIRPSTTSLQMQARAKNVVSSYMGIAVGIGIPAGADIEELAFIVLMNATNDQDNDLQDIMNEVQAQTKAKQFLRQQMQIANNAVANNASQQNANQQSNPPLVRATLSSFAMNIIRHHK